MDSPSRSVLKLYVGICLFLIPSLFYAQSSKTLVLNDSTRILKLTSNAAQIEVDSEDNLLLLFPDESQVNRYLVDYHYDSVLTVGGKSNREDGFLQPVKMSIYNRQLLYVLDETQQKLSLLNKDLKVIKENQFALRSVFDDRNSEMYAISFAVSPSGEIFLLNQFNNKIYKINLFGEIEIQFGGLDFGEGSLLEPQDIQIDPANQIFVSEPESGHIKVFDLYGVYIYTLSIKADPFVWKNFHLTDDLLFCWNEEQILVMNLLKRNTWFLRISPLHSLTDLYFQGQNLYLLLENEVHLYRINP